MQLTSVHRSRDSEMRGLYLIGQVLAMLDGFGGVEVTLVRWAVLLNNETCSTESAALSRQFL